MQRRTLDPASLLQFALAIGLVWFAVQAVQLARLKSFSIDEFQSRALEASARYARGARSWLNPWPRLPTAPTAWS